MKRFFLGLSVGVAVLGAAVAVAAQPKPEEPPRAIVSIYHIAPGKHADFLKWLAAQEAVEKEVGAPPSQLYVHTDGDSWDYVHIVPQLDAVAQDAIDKKFEAAAAKKGMAIGPKRGLELRTMMMSHTDTFVVGPINAQQAVDAISK